MRIRSVKPEFYRDEITGLMACDVALFYLGLCGFADDRGNFEWNPALVRADVDPYDAKWGGAEGVKAQLANLERLGRVIRYEVGGRAYGSIVSFSKHQHPQKPAYRCPLPSTGGVQEESCTGQGGVGSVVVVGSGRGEGSGYGGGSGGAAAECPAKGLKYPLAAKVLLRAVGHCGPFRDTPEDLLSTVQAAADRAGVDACLAEVDAVAKRQIAKGKTITSLAYFVRALQALPGIGEAPKGRATAAAADHSAFGTETREVKL